MFSLFKAPPVRQKEKESVEYFLNNSRSFKEMKKIADRMVRPENFNVAKDCDSQYYRLNILIEMIVQANGYKGIESVLSNLPTQNIIQSGVTYIGAFISDDAAFYYYCHQFLKEVEQAASAYHQNERSSLRA